MNTTCDSTTMEILRRIVGTRLEWVAARRYPGYLAYSQVIATFADGLSVQIDLREETPAPMFEVFVAQARAVESPIVTNEWDRFEFGDFVVANMFVLRREEWIEKSPDATYQTVGSHGVEQKFGSIDSGGEGHDAVTVDSGVCFASARGAELAIDADTFPLVLQLRYEVTSSPLPRSTRIAV